jgi:putative alpha-1,2-mannosidase
MRPATIVIAASISVCKALSQKDYTQHVNLFIGTEGPVAGSAYSAGNVFPGATLPFGAVKVGIDTTRSAIVPQFMFIPNRADIRNKDGIYHLQLMQGTRQMETAM